MAILATEGLMNKRCFYHIKKSVICNVEIKLKRVMFISLFKHSAKQATIMCNVKR